MKITGALAIYREMGTSVLFATRRELEYRKTPPLSLPSLVRVILPSLLFHLFLLSSSSRLGPQTTISTAPQSPASPKSSTPFIFISNASTLVVTVIVVVMVMWMTTTTRRHYREDGVGLWCWPATRQPNPGPAFVIADESQPLDWPMFCWEENWLLSG